MQQILNVNGIKRIAVLHPTMMNHGGAEFVVDRLCTELVKKGFSVTLFTDKFDHNFFGIDKNYIIREFNTGEQDFPFRRWKKIASQISKELEYFDIINPHNYPSYFYWYYAKKNNPKITAPVIWYCEEPYRFYYGSYLQIIDENTNKVLSREYPETRFKLYKRIYNECGLLYLLRYIYGQKYTINKNIREDQNIINKVDMVLCNSIFTATNAKKCFKRECLPCQLGIVSDLKNVRINYQKYVLTVSRIEQIKNIMSGIRAFENLSNKGLLNGYKYIIAGKGKQFSEVENYIKERNLTKVVELKGFVTEEEKISLYCNASFILNLPIDEPFGLVCLEAFAYRKTIITSDHGGPAEIVRSTNHGILVNPDQINEIEKAIQSLIQQPEKAKQMGENGYQLLIKEYLFEHFMKRYLSYIIPLIDKRK